MLALTSDLASSDMRRRIAETAQMLMDIMDAGPRSPNTLEPGGQGHLTVRGVRLLHAVVRDTILTSPVVTHTCDEAVPRRWCAAWGHPINQEDLLGTLLTFTVSVLNAMDRIGIPYDDDGAEGYVHAWCVVGAQLGIDPGLLPLTRAEATELADTIYRRQHGASVAGERLMDVLLAQMELAMPWGLRKLPRTLVRQMTRPGVADLVGVPKAAWWRPLLDATRATGSALRRVPGADKVFAVPGDLLGRSMIRMFVDSELDGVRPGVPARRDHGRRAGGDDLRHPPRPAPRPRRRPCAARRSPTVETRGPGEALLTGHRPAHRAESPGTELAS